jgi:DNA (cytosine-5)-methyltransferase 1
MNNMDKYIVPKGTWECLQRRKQQHKKLGEGFGYSLNTGKDISRTLSARYGKDGGEILIDRGEGKRPRKLTEIECERLQAFPDNWTEGLSKTQRYKTLGNSVTTTVITALMDRLCDE